jgi:hypothetical protein
LLLDLSDELSGKDRDVALAIHQLSELGVLLMGRSQIGSDADHSTVPGLPGREARGILESLQYTAGAADHHRL